MTEAARSDGSTAAPREIGLGGVFSIAAGAMISSGLFVLPGLAFEKAGPAMVLAYGLASLLVIPVLFSTAEIATAMPKAGGNYFFIMRSLGPLFGTVAGLADWFSLSLKTSFALVGLGTLAQYIMDDAGDEVMRLTAAGFCLFFAVLNAVSTKESGRLQVLLVAGLVAILAGYAVGGLREAQDTRYLPFVPHGWQAVFAVAGMVFVSFGGLTKVVAMAEEVKEPTRNLPLGMFLAFSVVSLLYLLIALAVIGITPPEGPDGLSGSTTPLLLRATTALGPVGPWLIGAAAFLAFATTGNAGVMAASRAPLAMSRDGLVPQKLAYESPVRHTPLAGIAVTAGFMLLLLLALDLESLVKTASTMMILTFLFINVSVIVLRESGLENYRPTFKTPLYPWPQVVAIILYGFLIVEMGRTALLLSAGFCALSLVWYFAYVRRRIDRDSALLFLVKRILSRHIRRARIDSELVQILLERDEIEFDRFDRLVASCPVLDIEDAIGVKELFRRISTVLPRELGLSDAQLYELFLEREREGSTVIQPGLAIPHIIVPGQGVFELVLVRCKGGVSFSELHAPVHTAFVLVGSSDQRGFHLRALMHIAHIVQEQGFEDRWRGARSPEQLRDLVLLSKRARQHDADTPPQAD